MNPLEIDLKFSKAQCGGTWIHQILAMQAHLWYIVPASCVFEEGIVSQDSHIMCHPGIVMLCLHWGVVPATWFPLYRWSALPFTKFWTQTWVIIHHHPSSSIIIHHHPSFPDFLIPSATPEVLCSMLLSRLLATMVAFVVICFLHLSSKSRHGIVMW